MFIFSLICAGLVLLYLYNTRNFNYWKKCGVKYIKPVLFLGSNKDNFLMRKSLTQSFTEWYKLYPDEKVVGYFRSSMPALLIRDPMLIKRILNTDFIYFYERGTHPNKTDIEPLLRNLFFVEGDLWRLLRQRMTPAFTSAKLKAMFSLIVECADRLQSRTLVAARDCCTIDSRDLMARYTTDFIGACGFGLDTKSLHEENSEFRKLGNEIFKSNTYTIIVALLKDAFPELSKNLKFLGRLENRFFSLVGQILQERNHMPSARNDFIDLMLECKNKGIVELESMEKFNPDGTPERVTLELTDQLITAQVLVFFAAGFETSSSATSFTLHQLAHHPEIQKQVQQNIDSVLSKYNNKLSYDAVKEFTYLHWAFQEAMRLFPSLGYIGRKTTQNYTFPELNLTVDKGVTIVIPLQGLHTDSKYFDHPLEFRPERFSADNLSETNKYTYLPFGEGPRACIGARLGKMQSLAGLAAILSRFTVKPAPQTKRHPTVEAKIDIVQSIDGGLPLLFIERNTHD